MTSDNEASKIETINVNGTLLTAKQIDVIKAIYDQFHAYLRSNEDYEHKISFAAITFFLGFSGLLLARKFAEFRELIDCGLISGILVAFAIVVHYFLRSNLKEMRSICQRIVCFEKAMGAYVSGLYAKDDSLLPLEYQHWGTPPSSSYSSSRPYFIGLWLSAAVALSSLWYDHHNLEISTPPPPDPTPIVSKFPDHLDLTLYQPDLAVSAQKPEVNQQLVERLAKLENDVKKLINDGSNPSFSTASGRFVVMFDDGINLSSKASQTIDNAVKSAKTATTVLCNGYSDPSGNDIPRGRAINLTVSKQRADLVAKALVQRGVPVEKVQAGGFGSHPEGRTVEILILK